MAVWHLKDYWPEPGVNLIERWYDRQEDAVVTEFEYALRVLAETSDLVNIPEFIALTGEHAGLYEMVLEAEQENGEPASFRVVGVWRPDSRDFIMLVVCELKAGVYDPPVSFALELKKSLEDGKGKIDEHYF